MVALVIIMVPAIYAKGKNGESETPPENVVARVNGNEILRENFERQINIMEQQLIGRGQPIDEKGMKAAHADVLEKLIDSELLFQESQNKGFRVDEEKLNEQIESVKNQFSTEEEFQSALDEMNYTEKSFRGDIEQRMAVQDFVESEITQNVVVSEEESRLYYDDHPEYFSQPEQVRASHILILVEDWSVPSHKEQALQKIKEIQQKLDAGEDFGALALEFSEGPSSAQSGDLGFFGKGQMVKPFEDAAFGLQPGETSDVVETTYGFHLILCTDRRDEVKIPYQYMKERIDNYLKQTKVVDAVDVLLEKMRADAEIERFLTEGEEDLLN
jgi:peptidyl-prolyl cis-trans isomerase C